MQQQNNKRLCTKKCRAVFVAVSGQIPAAGEQVLHLSFTAIYVKFLTPKKLIRPRRFALPAASTCQRHRNRQIEAAGLDRFDKLTTKKDKFDFRRNADGTNHCPQNTFIASG
jgi:hypothetical protein